MQFMALIYSVEGTGNDYEGGMEKLMADYYQFGQEARAAGVYVAGDALEAVSTATSVRIRDGEKSLTDGPFAETKETLGGYYLLDCKDLDEALEWGAKIPTAKYGTIEVRPLMVFEE